MAPIAQVLFNDPTVMSLLGPKILRFYNFGNQPITNPVYPYAVYQNYAGSPENYLGTLPDADTFSLQVDVYSPKGDECVNVAKAIRDAIEPHSYITRWGAQEVDNSKQPLIFRYSFDVDWMVLR